MASSESLYKVEFTEESIEEMIEIYEYISNKLKEDKIAKRLISEVNNRILDLAHSPELYMKIGKTDKRNKEYRRMVVKNYVVLYTIDYSQEKVFISHIVYGRRNYLNFI